MAYAVTHVIFAIVIISLYRRYIAKKRFSNWYVLIGGIAGLLPDIDMPVQWIVSSIVGETVKLHRVFTHSLMYIFIFLIIAAIFWIFKDRQFKMFNREWKSEQAAIISIIIAAGLFIHLALDCALASDNGMTILPGIPINFCPHPVSNEAMMGIDAIILILWLIHEEYANKIKEFT